MHSRAPVIDCPGEKIAERKRKRGGGTRKFFWAKVWLYFCTSSMMEGGEAKRASNYSSFVYSSRVRTSHLASSENGETSKKVSLVTTVSKANAQKEARAEAIDEVKCTESFVIRRGGGGGEGSKEGERKALWFRGIQIQ